MGLVADENRELRHALEERRRMRPVAGTILDAGDDAGERRCEPGHQVHRERDARHLGYVIEQDPQARIGDCLDDPCVPCVQTVVGHVVEEERRQHQAAGAARLHAMPREGDGFGQRRGAGGGDDPIARRRRRRAGRRVRRRVPSSRTIGPRRSSRTARRHRSPARGAIRMSSEASVVDAALAIERRQHRAPEALDCVIVGHGQDVRCRFIGPGVQYTCRRSLAR